MTPIEDTQYVLYHTHTDIQYYLTYTSDTE